MPCIDDETEILAWKCYSKQAAGVETEIDDTVCLAGREESLGIVAPVVITLEPITRGGRCQERGLINRGVVPWAETD